VRDLSVASTPGPCYSRRAGLSRETAAIFLRNEYLLTYDLFSAEWVNAWAELLRNDTTYRKAAKTWQWPMVVTIYADAAAGFPEDRSVFLDLWEGDCREARVATAADVEAAPFIIAADLDAFREILAGRTDPLTALMRGKLELVKGNLVKLLPYTQAAKQLVSIATAIPTRFPGDP
jgi:putative sterol carrier protein